MQIQYKVLKHINNVTQPHVYDNYSIMRLLMWKIGVLRRFLGGVRSLSILDFFKIGKANKKFKITEPKPAFICATGPSLNSLNRSMMESFAQIGAIFSINHFPITNIGTGIKIDYQMMLDAYHFNENNTDISETNFREWFQSKFNGTLVTTFNSKPNFKGATIRISGLCLPSFTKSINPMGIAGYLPYTTFHAISLALWLGYSPIYLLGVDASHHSKINIDKNGVTLGRHHAYDANLDGLPWKGRPDVSSILNSNAYFIQQCKLFSKYPVFIIESESHIDTLPRVSADFILNNKSF